MRLLLVIDGCVWIRLFCLLGDVEPCCAGRHAGRSLTLSARNDAGEEAMSHINRGVAILCEVEGLL